MNRRRLLKTGIGALGVLTGGAGMLAYRYLPPTPSTQLRPPDQIARDLLATLDPELKSRLQVDYDHAYRQYHNRGVWAGGVNVATGGFSRNQLSLIVDLMHSGLSAQGRQIIPNQLLLKLPDAVVNNLLICGEPGSAHCQILFTGPGNVYQPQFVAGMALFDALDTEQQALALQPDSPIQTRIEVQGAGGVFAGVPVAEMTPIQQNLAKRMIDLTFAPYPQEDVAYAWQCLEANGGLSSLHAAFYEDSRYDGRGGFQTYRLEGPSAVFYFRGFPHVHAFFNVAMDGEAPLSVGESLGHNPAVLEGPSLAALFERAMRHHSGADFGYYDPDSAVGRLRAGNVRSGDVYTAESWENQVVELNIKGAEITGGLAAGLAARGERLQPQRTYRVATVDFVADELLETAIGPASRVGESGLLRDQVIGYLRAEGFTG
jgi:hypothetical protein